MHEYEKRQEASGQPVHHKMMKELVAAAAAAEVQTRLAYALRWCQACLHPEVECKSDCHLHLAASAALLMHCGDVKHVCTLKGNASLMATCILRQVQQTSKAIQPDHLAAPVVLEFGSYWHSAC